MIKGKECSGNRWEVGGGRWEVTATVFQKNRYLRKDSRKWKVAVGS
jgi:hypothetical protein